MIGDVVLLVRVIASIPMNVVPFLTPRKLGVVVLGGDFEANLGYTRPCLK